jgi:hypothetical protein
MARGVDMTSIVGSSALPAIADLADALFASGRPDVADLLLAAAERLRPSRVDLLAAALFQLAATYPGALQPQQRALANAIEGDLWALRGGRLSGAPLWRTSLLQEVIGLTLDQQGLGAERIRTILREAGFFSGGFATQR